jgi:hypothetical protein
MSILLSLEAEVGAKIILLSTSIKAEKRADALTYIMQWNTTNLAENYHAPSFKLEGTLRTLNASPKVKKQVSHPTHGGQRPCSFWI